MARSNSGAKQNWASYLIGFVGCVVVPGFVTAIAPVSTVKLERRGETVSAQINTNAFFIVPYRKDHLAQVTEADDRFHAGEFTRKSHQRKNEGTYSEDESFLVLRGPAGTIEASVSPVNVDDVLAKAQAFLKDPQASELRLFVVANWKFSVIAGGLVSLLTVLYVVGVTISVLQFFARLVTGKPAQGS